ncbi:MAG: ATP-binding protein [Methylococcales bacterium]|nr:ATP-binding protein [Methylococcales bacterium]
MQPSFAVVDLITERAYFEDAGNQLTIEQVRQQVFTPYQGVLAKRFNYSTYWLRLTIDPSIVSGTDLSESVLMLIRPCVLDDIQLYDPLDPSPNPQMTGDTVDPKSNLNALTRSLSFNFSMPRGQQSRNVWLRVKSTSAVLVDVSVYIPDDFNKLNKERELIYSFNIAILVCFIVWAFFNWSISYEKLMGVFLLKQIITLVWFLFAYGFIRLYLYDYLPIWMIDKGTNLFILLSAISTFCFDYVLFKECHPLKRGSRLLQLLFAFFGIAFLLMVFGFTMRAIQLGFLASFFATFFAMLISIGLTFRSDYAENKSPLIANKLLLITYTFIFLMVIVSLLPIINLPFGTELILHVRAMHALVTGFIMLYLLQIRVRYMQKLHQSKLLELTIKEQEIDSERRHQKEKSEFLAMLAHDLKTPLAVAKMVLGSEQLSDKQINHVNQAVNDMNSVIERCLQVSELEDNQIPLKFIKIDLTKELDLLQQHSIATDRINIISDESISVQTDAQLLKIILVNLLDNAVKYSKAESLITVTVSYVEYEQSSGVEIRISNSPGKSGWPDPELLFQKYYRSKQARHLTGAGQGLYLVSQLAKILGGHIRFDPTNTHICFSLWLPN